METYRISLDAPTNSFKLTVPSAVGIHDTRELVPATKVWGKRPTLNGFWIARPRACTTATRSATIDKALPGHAGRESLYTMATMRERAARRCWLKARGRHRGLRHTVAPHVSLVDAENLTYGHGGALYRSSSFWAL